MKRRDILKQSALFAGAALSAGTVAALVSGCQPDVTVVAKEAANTGLSQDQLTLVAEIAERIIPKTDTPGAKDAKVHDFINSAIKNTFTTEEASQFKQGLSIFNSMSEEKYTKKFESLSGEEKDQILTELVTDFKSKDNSEPHIWPAIKGLVITGFFTSEIGAKESLKYDPIPGEWIGCIDYDEVGGLWAI